MACVTFTRHLQKFFPDLDVIEIDGDTVADIVRELDKRYPGISGYLLENTGALRKHVNIFVDNSLITDRTALSDSVHSSSSIHILQALSGG